MLINPFVEDVLIGEYLAEIQRAAARRTLLRGLKTAGSSNRRSSIWQRALAALAARANRLERMAAR